MGDHRPSFQHLLQSVEKEYDMGSGLIRLSGCKLRASLMFLFGRWFVPGGLAGGKAASVDGKLQECPPLPKMVMVCSPEKGWSRARHVICRLCKRLKVAHLAQGGRI